MRRSLTICFMVIATLPAAAVAADPSPITASASTALSGVVLEVIPVEEYSYLRIKTRDGERWAAVGKAVIKVGDAATIDNAMVMKNFESKTLKRTFSDITFGTLAGNGQGTGSPHGGGTPLTVLKPSAVSKATGANAHTVAEIVAKGAELKDKQVRLHAQVVKFNPDIMGKNWIHLRDGSGTDAAHNNDILVTSAGRANVGDVITVTGLVRMDKDFGAGYAYKVLIEEGSIQP